VTLSTHVLDVEAGRPAPMIPVRAEVYGDGGVWRVVGSGVTDAQGRIGDLVPATVWGPGRWRLVFDVVAHYGPEAFWPQITLDFRVSDATHHHVPVLLARHGYSTYRGS
jgi:5-hydroxyisourate hydrolase